MTSLNANATALLETYNAAMGLDLAMNAAYERWLVEASNAGLTSEGFELAIRARNKFNAQGGFRKGTLLHHFVMGEDAIAITLNEAAVAKAQLRVRVMDKGKASVLRATGRPDSVPAQDAVKVGDMALIEQLRKAAE